MAKGQTVRISTRPAADVSYRDMIDIGDDLVEEWNLQPRRMLDACEAEADARHALNEAEAELKIIYSKIELAIRKDPGSWELDAKPTEGAIKATIQLDPKYQDATGRVHEAQRILDRMKARVTALTDKRRAMERRVELMAIDYYAEPRARTAGAAEVRDKLASERAIKPIRRRNRADADEE